MSFFRFAFLFVLVVFSSAFASPKVVLFNDTSAWYHWGCTGTSTALKKGIQDLGFEIEAISIAQTKMFQEIPPFEEFDDLKKFEKFSQENKEIIEIIRNASAVVITGEGTLHDLRKGPQTLLYIAHISKKFLQKHVEIINHSAYPKDDQALIGPFAEKGEEELERANSIYKNVYDKLDFVAIREPISQRVMEEIGISSILSFDCLPLYIRDLYSTKKCIEHKTAVLSGSIAFSATGLENICRYLEALSKEGYEIKVLIGAAAFPSEDDKLFVDFLRRHCKAPWKLIFASSMQEWLDTINHATFLVSGRFHHSIAAFCLDTPFIALNSNTHEVHAICSFLEQDPPLLFSDPQLLENLLLRTKALVNSAAEDNGVKKAEICNLAEQNLDGLKTLLAEMEAAPAKTLEIL